MEKTAHLHQRIARIADFVRAALHASRLPVFAPPARTASAAPGHLSGGEPRAHRRQALLMVLALCCSALAVAARPSTNASAALSVSYGGVDYVQPSAYFTGCSAWTWLQAGCYTNTSRTSNHVSPQQRFASDAAFMRSHGLGTFQRVWISLDQLMTWNSSSGYAGFSSQALANVDDMLHRAAANGIKVELVLLTNTGISAVNQFHPEAVDGNHAAMRANYLKAVHDFVRHLASGATGDYKAIAVIDLQNEAYYQLEAYFNTPAHLGRWHYAEPSWPTSKQCMVIGNSVCTGGSSGHGCVTSTGHTDWGCVDVNIIEPWLHDLYTTAKNAAAGFSYTISDTGRLLTTSTSTYASQAWWVHMYPVDVYDVHVYDDAPWNNASRYASGRTLPKPWLAGEAGCAIGHPQCTYDGTSSSTVAQWWLSNLKGDGANAVLIDDYTTVVRYVDTSGGPQPTLTTTGQEIATANQG